MGMAVESGGLTVSGPTGVCNASMRIEDLVHVDAGFCDEFLELCDLSNLLEGIDLILLVAVDGKASGVIPAVLQT
jgi:hypothetical protein